MEYIKAKGLVCKITEYKDSDKILTLLTYEYGKMQVIAKGVKKKGAALSHAARLFFCGNFECVRSSRGLPILTGASMIQDFFDLTHKIETLYYASHFVDVCSYFIQEQQPADEIMPLLLNSLYLLMRKETNPVLLTAILQFRIAALEGSAPITEFCVDCDEALDESCSFCFSFENDGISCCNTDTCISYGVYHAIHEICTGESSKIFFFDIAEKDIPILFNLSSSYLEKISGIHFDILDNLSNL